MITTRAMPEFVPLLLAGMGSERVATVERHAGGSAEAAIRRNIEHSTYTWCGLDGRAVISFGGILPQSYGGYLWQYVCDVARHRRAYVQQQRDILTAGLDLYPRLRTVIEADYTAALRHMRRLGFAVSPPREINGVAACVCERGRL